MPKENSPYERLLIRAGQFREYLRMELLRRCKTNPRYSMRAFARSLGVQSSFLSKILSGKRSITLRTFTRFSDSLGLSPSERENFQIPFGSSSFALGTKYRSLAEDSFHLISDWYHFGILELFTVEGFRATPAYISKRLGITQIEAQDALRRLERLKFIRRKRNGYEVLSQHNTTTNTPTTHVALKRLQKQVLQMAILSLDEVPIELRDQSTMTMAINSELLPEAKKRIQAFRRSLCDFLQKQKSKDSVYQLTVSLYPITREIKENK